MPPSTRRTFLAGIATPLTAVPAGCLGRQSDEPTVGSTTDTPGFEGLSTDGMTTECPMPDYAFHATTPVPYPTPAASTDAGVAIDLATDIEAAYLDNWVVLNYEPLPTATTTSGREAAPDIQYPAVSASYQSRRVLQRTPGVVVHLEYERLINGDVAGRYTVNYYLTASAVARAEATGYRQPGPHPTEEGVLLSCW